MHKTKSIYLIVVLSTLYAQGIVNTKHDFSVSSLGATIKAVNEEQVCVFCHTTHSSDQIAQLWNKVVTSETNYTLYSSERLSGYPNPSQPKSSSKLCMSCHDGTVAIGSVYNRPGPGLSGTILMAGGVSELPSSSSGLIGTDLSDDHPVGFTYDTNKDPELITRSWPWKNQGISVLLEPDASNGTIECTTCHNPHSNYYEPFLNTPENSLCITCHSKNGWSVSVHFSYGCGQCHQSHTSGKALLGSSEEQNCYTSGCHGNVNPATGNSGRILDIETQLDYVNAHPTHSTNGIHFAGEISTVDFANRHAECADCHDPHQTGGTTNNDLSTALKGTNGVEPIIWPTPIDNLINNDNEFIAPGGYTFLESVDYEYQICLKCHSNYTSQVAGQKNIAEGINPYYRSTHGLVNRSVLDGSDGTEPRNPYVNSFNMEPPFDEEPTSYTRSLLCTDCHASEIIGTNLYSRTDAKGSHGSNVFVGSLDPMSNQSAMLTETIESSGAIGTPLCFLCHSKANYLDGPLVSSAFNKHPSNSPAHKNNISSQGVGEGCFGCHMLDKYENGISGNTQKIFIHGQNKRYNINEDDGSTGNAQVLDAFVNGRIADIDFENKTCQTEVGCHRGARTRSYNSIGP